VAKDSAVQLSRLVNAVQECTDRIKRMTNVRGLQMLLVLLSRAMFAVAVIRVKHLASDAADVNWLKWLASCAVLVGAVIKVKHLALDAADNIKPGPLKPFAVSPTSIPVLK
jgi:hypothetical protein